MRDQSIRNLYPTVVSINGESDATDTEGNPVVLDESLIDAEIVILQTQNTIDSISSKVQAHLDTTAKEWGYDTIYTAVGYIGDPDATFNSEGIMFRNWRSAVWVYVNAEQVKLENAQRTMPTDAELIAELPLLDTYK